MTDRVESSVKADGAAPAATSAPPSPAKGRLASLDAFRGATIIGMILVNNPGTWGAVYPPLLHAEWNGWTFTDLIFPFFLFIVGVAIVFAYSKRLERGVPKKPLVVKAMKRAAILFGLGLLLAAWPYFTFDPSFAIVPNAYTDDSHHGRAATDRGLLPGDNAAVPVHRLRDRGDGPSE